MAHKRQRWKRTPRVWYEYCTACEKVAYPDPQAANSVRVDFVRAQKSDRDVHVYRCPHSASWHIGSTRPRN